jgi:hypothetical protein
MDKPQSNSLSSALTSKRYQSFSSDINLTAATPAGASQATGCACRRIRINGAGGGNLAIQYADGSTDIIPVCVANEVHEVQAAKILTTGTDVTDVTVFW